MTLLVKASLCCDDETKLQRTVPYLVTLLGDAAASIRATAVR